MAQSGSARGLGPRGRRFKSCLPDQGQAKSFSTLYYVRMTFDEISKRAIEIRNKYDNLNKTKRGVVWNEQQLMAGFVGDVGDLSKIIMAKHGLRGMDEVDAKLAHELSDCLWSILVLAHKYNIDLGKEFMKTMDSLDVRIDNELQS